MALAMRIGGTPAVECTLLPPTSPPAAAFDSTCARSTPSERDAATVLQTVPDRYLERSGAIRAHARAPTCRPPTRHTCADRRARHARRERRVALRISAQAADAAAAIAAAIDAAARVAAAVDLLRREVLQGSTS